MMALTLGKKAARRSKLRLAPPVRAASDDLQNKPCTGGCDIEDVWLRRGPTPGALACLAPRRAQHQNDHVGPALESMDRSCLHAMPALLPCHVLHMLGNGTEGLQR